MRNIADTLALLPRPALARIAAPPYSPKERGRKKDVRVGLAVEAMSRHTSDEGWQLFAGLEEGGGYTLAGWALDTYGGYEGSHTCSSMTDVRDILSYTQGNTVLVQDKREWEGMTAERRFDPAAYFRNIEHLREREDVWKGTVLKDAHQQPPYHRDSALEMGAHFWVIYYHPALVTHLAPYVRPPHLIRTYHTVSASLVPPYSTAPRKRALLSGALSPAYPLRRALANDPRAWDVLPHPGYRSTACYTPDYLKTLSRYKVAICTSSIYGYALRKIIEATACGCMVLTDLPTDEVLPEIDLNLWRASPRSTPREVSAAVKDMAANYDAGLQQDFATKAMEWYDYRKVGARLAADIERLRQSYNPNI